MRQTDYPASWLTRGLLTFAALAFAFLGTKYFAQPASTSAIDGISLNTPAAITDMRVVGAVFLACSIVTLSTLLSPSLHLNGLRFVVIVVSAVTLGRAYGFVTDGGALSTVVKLRNEVVLLAVFGAGLWFEMRRGRYRLARNTSDVPHAG